MKQVPYTISKTGKPINNQQDLIDDLVIALGLIEKGDKTQREQGAKILIELMNCPIEEPANRLNAMKEAKNAIN